MKFVVLLILLLTFNPNPTKPNQSATQPICQRENSKQDLERSKEYGTKEVMGLRLLDNLVLGGFTPIVAAGIVGNISQESDILPHISGKSGVGLCQWNGYRKHGLMKFAIKHKKSWKSPEIQVQWIIHELTQGTETEYYPKIITATTPGEAALKFSRHYERPNRRKANNTFRVAEAKRFYRLWKNDSSN